MVQMFLTWPLTLTLQAGRNLTHFLFQTSVRGEVPRRNQAGTPLLKEAIRQISRQKSCF